MKSKKNMSGLLILICVPAVGVSIAMYIAYTKSGHIKQKENKVVQQHSSEDRGLSPESPVHTQVSAMKEAGDEMQLVSGSTKDTLVGSNLEFIDNEVYTHAKMKAGQAFFDAKYSDPREFVKLKWRDGMPYEKARQLIQKEKLPLLYDMLEDRRYALYWHYVARLIGYISDDPNSVPVLLRYFERDDGENISLLVGKIWSIAFIGKIGGDQADVILQKAVTEDGAAELVAAWINKELWPDKTWSKKEAIEYIRNAAMQGLVYTGKPENIDIVKKLYEKEVAFVINNKKPTKLCAYLIDAMAAKDFIAENGLESYLMLHGSKKVRTLWPYLKKYGPPPPKKLTMGPSVESVD